MGKNQNRKYVEVFCKDCGETYLKREDSLKKWSGLCRKCHELSLGKAYGPLRRKYEETSCLQCGKVFFPHSGNKGIFCSLTCFGLSRVGRISPSKGVKRPHTAGKNRYNWKGGLSSEYELDRKSLQAKEWKQKVFERDGYTCQKCRCLGKGDLNAHHIENFNTNKEKRFDIENGCTLCKTCHMLFHKLFGRTGNNHEQLTEYLTTPTSQIIPIKHRLDIKDPIFIMNFLI